MKNIKKNYTPGVATKDPDYILVTLETGLMTGYCIYSVIKLI